MIPLNLSPFANHLWQSTLFAGAAALLALALKQNRAQLRYRIWLAASIKFLIPFSLLLSVGSQFEWRTARTAPPPLASAIQQVSQPFAPPLPASTPTQPARWPATLLFAAWLCGSVGVVSRWCVRWRRVRMAMQSASRLPIAGPVQVWSSRTRLEPGVFGVFQPVLLLPEGIADRLSPAQLQAILSHEFCHVRRRDNLTAALHMLVEAVFWFHPLVWWIGARLVDERERACDEEVLAQGSEPEVYAASILNVCRFYLESRLACASGVTGADLKKRIAAIMAKPILRRLTLARKLLLTAAGLGAVAGPILIGIVNAPPSRAQTAAAPLRFEVASIKPTKGEGGKGGLVILPGGGLRMGNTTLKMLIALAYNVRDNEISGGPNWIGSETYAILATPEGSDPADNPGRSPAPGSVAWDRVCKRIQTLLAERFQLVIHKDAKEGAGYALLLAKSGFKLQQSSDQGPARTMRDFGRIDAHTGTTQMLAAVLTGYLGRPVVDRTGLTGTYDYTLEYSQEPRGADASPPVLPGPSIFTAIQEQLGLKIESARVTTETIVIDRAEKPSAN
jgi:uncharacterized protein (TIGR03435 family)